MKSLMFALLFIVSGNVFALRPSLGGGQAGYYTLCKDLDKPGLSLPCHMCGASVVSSDDQYECSVRKSGSISNKVKSLISR